MKRFLILVLVFVTVFAVSCSKKKSHDYKEQVSKEIKADEGGTVESSDGKTSVEIPGGALDEDTTITMTIYDASEYSDEKGKIVSKVVNFEPNGTIFKKPVIITMNVEEGFEDKIVAPAVYNETEGKWSYSENGERAILGRDDSGDPIMMGVSSSGDPIMLGVDSEGSLTAAGDPIMSSAAGDPIMLASAGDPIMGAAAGNPIMSSAAGDPIMMTTGHFTEYTFIVLDPKEPGENDDDADTSDNDIPDTEITDIDDTDPTEPSDDDIVPEPEPVYSTLPCTGLRTCVNASVSGENSDSAGFTRWLDLHRLIGTDTFVCPKEGEDFYGQDTNYIIRKSCIPQSFERVVKAESDETPYQQIKDNVTGLTWLYTDKSGSFAEMSAFCSGLDYEGKTWRLPTPKEALTIINNDDLYGTGAFRALYFPELISNGEESSNSFWTSVEGLYLYDDGSIMASNSSDAEFSVLCVSGNEYGKAGEYEIRNAGGEETVFDPSTNLLWQKAYVEDKTFKEALLYCENLTYAGYTSWRLPNKNELASLLDYSKTGEEVFSSFPEMAAKVFVSSTPLITIGGDSMDIDPWAVSMSEGRVDYVLGEDDEEGPMTRYVRLNDSHFAVRCVLSRLDEAPADGIPECDEKIGYTPCRHEGILWSPRMPFSPSNWGEVGSYFRDMIMEACRDMTLEGKRQWRVPTTDELTTLMKDEESYESKLRDSEILISGDFGDDNEYPPVWALDPLGGGIIDFRDAEYPSEVVARCVLDETLPDYEFPYTQEFGDDGYLKWSALSWSYMTYDEAAEYCGTLNTGDLDNFWRLPTEDELVSLFMDEGPYHDEEINSYGKNSFFGDVTTLWISDGDVVDFMEGSAWAGGDEKTARVRCVSDGPNPCKDDPCAEIEHSNGCIPRSTTEYTCTCEGDYFLLDETQCVNPCDSNPCAEIDNATGCISESASEFSCTCIDGYGWYDHGCVNMAS